MVAPTLIFLATYLVLAFGRMPPYRIDRTGAAIIGASLMIAFDVLTLGEAYAAVNYDTIMLLFGTMIVVANLRLSGFFSAVSEWVVEHAHRPIVLLISIVAVSGIFSAFFVNDTMCIVLTPLVLEIMAALGRNPIPYLLAVAMASNVGSVATITGNPQNMMIGSFSGIPYRQFVTALSPVAILGLFATIVVIACVYGKEFRLDQRMTIERRPARVNRVLMWKAIAASVGMIVFFFLGWPVPKVALVAGALLLITRRVKPEKVYMQIDWQLLVLFVGLFIVVAGMEKTIMSSDLPGLVSQFQLEEIGWLSTLTAILSNLVSNVPAVLVLKPFLAHFANPTRGWLTIAMASTLAGNLTILGSVANLIVVQRARRTVEITFWEYFKAGAPLTVITILIGILILG
ncbi:MAG: anion transporter [Acidobacteriota bacterium]